MCGAADVSEAEGRRELEGEIFVEGKTQQKEVPNDLKIVLPSERELEKRLERNRNENGNNLSLCLYLGS